VGKTLAEATVGVGLRILRGSTLIGFWEAEAAHLKAGDRIIEIIPEHLFPKVRA
jgi:voltage-gated potassium channel